MSEKFRTPEQQEAYLEELIEMVAEREEINAEDIKSDIITFVPHVQNESSNPEYFEELAELLGVSVEEITTYAIKKFEEVEEDY